MTGGELLVRALADCGVDSAFGYPGYHTIFIHDALNEGCGIRHILMRHEQATTFAADGYARASGKTAAAIVTAGPGATNALTGVAEAYSDSIPLLLVSASKLLENT